MKRAFGALVATVAGLAALLGYKSGPAKRAQLALPQANPPAAPLGAPPPAASQSAAAQSPQQGWGDDSSGSAATTAPPAPSTRAPTTTTMTTVPANGAPRAITGPDIANDYGDVQVQLTVLGNRILDVRALQLPHDLPRSYELSLAAAPVLRTEVLRAQSADIDLVSGASYTSQSYAQSVQAALDRARA